MYGSSQRAAAAKPEAGDTGNFGNTVFQQRETKKGKTEPQKMTNCRHDRRAMAENLTTSRDRNRKCPCQQRESNDNATG